MKKLFVTGVSLLYMTGIVEAAKPSSRMLQQHQAAALAPISGVCKQKSIGGKTRIKRRTAANTTAVIRRLMQTRIQDGLRYVYDRNNSVFYTVRTSSKKSKKKSKPVDPIVAIQRVTGAPVEPYFYDVGYDLDGDPLFREGAGLRLVKIVKKASKVGKKSYKYQISPVTGLTSLPAARVNYAGICMDVGLQIVAKIYGKLNDTNSVFKFSMPRRPPALWFLSHSNPTSSVFWINGKAHAIKSGQHYPGAGVYDRLTKKYSTGDTRRIGPTSWTHAEGHIGEIIYQVKKLGKLRSFSQLGNGDGTGIKIHINNTYGPCDTCQANVHKAFPNGIKFKVFWPWSTWAWYLGEHYTDVGTQN